MRISRIGHCATLDAGSNGSRSLVPEVRDRVTLEDDNKEESDGRADHEEHDEVNDPALRRATCHAQEEEADGDAEGCAG